MIYEKSHGVKMALLYTVIEETTEGEKTQTYEGFCVAAPLCLDHGCSFLKVKPEQKPPEARYLGIVVWEDTVTLYWLEDKALSVEEIKRMWRMQPGIDVEVYVYQHVTE